MNICVHTRPRLLLTASVSRLERRSQGLSMKRHLLMGKLQNRIYSLQTSNSTAPHSTPIYMAPSSPCLNCSAPHDTTDLVAAIEEQPAALCGGWLISLSSPFSPKEKKKKKHTKTAQQLKHHCNTRKGCSFIPMRNNSGFI